MKNEKLTNYLLALILIALVANLVIPHLRAREAGAAGEDAVPPAAKAAEVAKDLALDKVAGQIADGLRQIAQSNHQIAVAILEHSRSNEKIAYSLDRVATRLKTEEAAP